MSIFLKRTKTFVHLDHGGWIEAFDQITGNVKTHISISPNGNDTVKFKNHLILAFDNGQTIKQDRASIMLSQDNRDYYS